MSNLLKNTATSEWVDCLIKNNSNSIFGRLEPAIIWINTLNDHGELLIPINPFELVAEINSDPFLLLHEHDPGQPIGKIIESKVFDSKDGEKFIAAVFGFYAGGDVLNFQDLGIDTKTSVPPPKTLPVLPDHSKIQFATDPREVDIAWLDKVTSAAPLQIERIKLSHNEANSIQELIRINIPYLLLVWNPFVTAIASEAGKGTYVAFKVWFNKLIEQLAHLKKPILDVQSHQDGCQVSFLFRGKNVKLNYAAHQALEDGATKAKKLIANLNAHELPAKQLNYEFDKESLIWFPSYAILNDGRIITDSTRLISIEQLPTNLSLGLIV